LGTVVKLLLTAFENRSAGCPILADYARVGILGDVIFVAIGI
jgi:hypothetical protein